MSTSPLRPPTSATTTGNRQVPLKVVNIFSISYTGTTWLNLVLGTHPRTFALGPPDRAWRICRTGSGTNCLIHGDDCPFWRGFARSWRPETNFLIELAAAAGVEAVIINNPTPEFREAVLQHPGIDERTIRLVRDGRAVAASYARKFPDAGFVGAVGDFLQLPLQYFPFDPDNTATLDLRYEDIQADPLAALATIGAFTDIDYNASALAFWQGNHHVTAANVGPVALIKRYHGLPLNDFRGRRFYEHAFEELQAAPMRAFGDERWHGELTRRDLFLFDLVCGADNRRLGYARDGFDVDEVLAFAREFAAIRAAGELPASLAEPVARLISALSVTAADAEVSR